MDVVFICGLVETAGFVLAADIVEGVKEERGLIEEPVRAAEALWEFWGELTVYGGGGGGRDSGHSGRWSSCTRAAGAATRGGLRGSSLVHHGIILEVVVEDRGISTL